MLTRDSGGVSPKTAAAGLGGALATVFWVVAAATFWKDVFDATALTALTGATTTILAFALGFFVKDPLRQQGLQSMGAAAPPGPPQESTK